MYIWICKQVLIQIIVTTMVATHKLLILTNYKLLTLTISRKTGMKSSHVYKEKKDLLRLNKQLPILVAQKYITLLHIQNYFSVEQETLKRSTETSLQVFPIPNQSVLKDQLLTRPKREVTTIP